MNHESRAPAHRYTLPRHTRVAAVLPVLLLAGCATGNYGSTPEPVTPAPQFREVPNADFSAIGAASSAQERDRRAILAMRGDHRVDFHFMETVRLGAGYERHDDKTTGGYEAVRVIENAPDRIVLQHLLVMPSGHVIKHWRQDWTFEAATRFEFVADQTWTVTEIPAEKTTGAWTQCVYEVSDAPRYCGTGKWNHRYGVSTWTSDRSWRPLPRREYTKRDDYNAINAENRHTVTPNGWTHEQDNTKTARDGRETSATLVREFGFNDYRTVEDYDFSPADDYWARTGAYWADVRDAWAARLQPGSTLRIDTEVDGMPIIEGTFAQADKAGEVPATERRAAIDALLDTYTSNPDRVPDTDLAAARR